VFNLRFEIMWEKSWYQKAKHYLDRSKKKSYHNRTNQSTKSLFWE